MMHNLEHHGNPTTRCSTSPWENVPETWPIQTLVSRMLSISTPRLSIVHWQIWSFRHKGVQFGTPSKPELGFDQIFDFCSDLTHGQQVSFEFGNQKYCHVRKHLLNRFTNTLSIEQKVLRINVFKCLIINDIKEKCAGAYILLIVRMHRKFSKNAIWNTVKGNQQLYAERWRCEVWASICFLSSLLLYCLAWIAGRGTSSNGYCHQYVVYSMMRNTFSWIGKKSSEQCLPF